MESLRKSWKRLPRQARQAIVLVIGMAFVIAAPFTGVLPGPGGIPVFLIGVAILATEFKWAQRLRDWILELVKQMADHYKRNRTQGIILTVLLMIAGITISYIVYTRIL